MKSKIAILSILANIVLAVTKIIVGLFTHSLSIFAAGVDSFSDIFSSLISYIGIRLSSAPPDKKHPYGYHKYEVVAGGLIAIIIIATGSGIIYQAIVSLGQPSNISIGYLAIGVMLFSAVINFGMARLKIYYGKKENSVGLLSDGIHSTIDVYTSLAVFGGLILSIFWVYADALLAVLVGLYVIKEAVSLGKEIMGSLLDVSAGEEVEEEIKDTIHKEGVKILSIKTQKRGSIITANIEIELEGSLSVEKAVQLSSSLRDKLVKKIVSLRYVVIEISSHKMETGFFKPEFGESMRWEHKGRYKNELGSAVGMGPGGMCVCPQCGYRHEHEKGVPCAKSVCPNCQIPLERA